MAKIKKGQHLSPDTEIKKGQHLSPSTEFKKGYYPGTGFKKGHIPIYKLIPVPKHIRDKMSASHKGKRTSPATELTSERVKSWWQDRKHREAVSKAISAKAKHNWQNPEFVKTMMIAFNKKPTKPEKQLEAILNKHLPEFKYNGDGRLGVTLGGLTPDFVNVDGKKDLIEVFGDYYHSPEVLDDRWQGSELGRIMVYNSLGWRCLVIWENELKELTEEQLVDKIRIFFRGKAGQN